MNSQQTTLLIEPLIAMESNIAQSKGLNLGYTTKFDRYIQKLKDNTVTVN